MSPVPDPERWSRVRAIFEAAIEREPAGRTVFVEQACHGDAVLIAEVRALLVSYDESSGFLEQPAAELSRATPAADAMEGRTIGPYKLIRRIGSGGMGSVYAAARIDEDFRQTVAIKLVRPEVESEEILRRFRNERQVLAALDHPHIARLLDGGTTAEGLPYLVMEYVEGIPIDRYCDHHRLSVSERLKLFCAVCLAVQYAHQNLVVHRDLKPGNILITAQGVPKLLDFGIAKLLRPDHSAQTAHLTRTNLRPMTPEYASPEQVRGDPITTASDVYSLGVVLYQLLTGFPPYRLATHAASEVEQAICEAQPERPSHAVTHVHPSEALTPEKVSETREGGPDRLRKRLRGDLDMIVLMALRKEPRRRYPSVERFQDDICRHLEGRPVSARKDTWRYRLGKFAGRHTIGVAASALAIVALLASTAASIYYARAAHRQNAHVLELTGYILSDFDPAIQSGDTPARKAFLEKVLALLTQLSPHATTDPTVRRLLISTYLRVGDLQGNLSVPNLGDAAGARASYERAMKLAGTAVAEKGDPESQRDLALAELRLGELEAYHGDQRAALAQYRRSDAIFRKLLGAAPERPQAIRDVMTAAQKIGSTEYRLGDLPAALESYQRYRRSSEQLGRVQGLSILVRRNIALADEHTGEILAASGRSGEGIANLRQAVESFENMARLAPENTGLQHDTAMASLVLAAAVKGKPSETGQLFRKAAGILERLSQQDPANQQYQRDLASAKQGLAEALFAVKSNGDAKKATGDALSILHGLVSAPNPTLHDVHLYIWILLTTPFPDLHNPSEALRYSRMAADLSHRKNPALQDLLARALFESGDRSGAIAAEEQAIALLPALQPGEAPSDYHVEFESNLERFRAQR